MQVENKDKLEQLKSSGFVQGTGRAGWTGFFFFGLVSVANILKSYETSYKVRHQTLPLTN